MNLQHYFDFGAPNNQGLHFGLWEPVLNRFLLVLSDQHYATTVKFLASSRYKLFLINLTTADNYHKNLVDNTCCENWTISNRKDISIIHPSRYTDPVPAVKLIANDTELDWDIDQERTWLQTIVFWSKFIDQLKKQHSWTAYDSFIQKLHTQAELPGQGQSWYDRLELLEKDILKTLYLGTDVSEINAHIEQLLMKDSYIFDIWQQSMSYPVKESK